MAILATEYLKRQRKHWPELVAGGLIPEPTPATIEQMVEDFKHRHRTGEVSPDALSIFLRFVKYLASSYARFSCHNSKPTSIVDQTNKILGKAIDEKRFIPWQYVFADYAVSGLKASRIGYMSLKRLLKDGAHRIETLYIDDFTRPSRDEIEWWRLAQSVRRLRKRLIGASDGFDLNSPQGELMVAIFGILSRLFIKSIREKVSRGMKGAAERGTVLGRLLFGLARRVRHDENGEAVLNHDGTPVTEPCIDPDAVPIVLEMIDKFVVKKLSVYKIVQWLNDIKADNYDRWTKRNVWNVLESPALIGVFIWNKFRTEYDYELNRYVKIRNPRPEWSVVYRKEIAQISLDKFRALRRRLAEVRRPKKHGKPTVSRNLVSATTLMSGTLICGYCGRELVLFRSGKCKMMYCPNGRDHIANCQLTTSKSLRIIETVILGLLRDHILTDENLEMVVMQANLYLAELAAQLPADVAPLKSRIRKTEQKINRYYRDLEDEENESVRKNIRSRIKELNVLVVADTQELRKLAPLNQRQIKPLDVGQLKAYLDDMLGLMNQEIPAAADAIRRLTGPIRITQRPRPKSRHGAIWLATFAPNFADMLRRQAKDKSCPDTVTLEILCERIWTLPKELEMVIDSIPACIPDGDKATAKKQISQ